MQALKSATLPMGGIPVTGSMVLDLEQGTVSCRVIFSIAAVKTVPDDRLRIGIAGRLIAVTREPGAHSADLPPNAAACI